MKTGENENKVMDKKDVEKAFKRYIAQLFGIVAALCLLAGTLMSLEVVGDIMMPLTVSCIFMLAVGIVISFVWKKVAMSSPDSLTTFFTAVSGFRMLLALMTLLGCYIAVGRDNMDKYVIVFMVFYFASLAHHSMFFAHINNKN
ncbi:hypothetical protein HPS57_06190 [Prevotella sp. PINT]|jgi:hypothetical protein|nr:hypothetical protein [Palleniella intestinalis]